MVAVKERMMPARAPGQHPAEGATNQEHKIEHQKDQLADDQAHLAADRGRQSPDTETKPRDHRRTWLDVGPDSLREMPTDALYTRDEVFELLRDRGIDVSEVTLVYWEKTGILPRPARRRREGAPRALYPPWAVDAIAHLRALQAEGRTLEQIAPLMRAWELPPTLWNDPVNPALTDARTALLAYAQAIGLDVLQIEGITIRFNDNVDATMHEETLTVPVELRQTLARG